MKFPLRIFRTVLFFLFLNAAFGVQAQDKYWILLTDKGESVSWCAEDLLSEAALTRRAQQGISIDERDYPLYLPYMAQLEQMGVQPLVRSRWLNALSAHLSPDQLAHLSVLPFVKEIRPVALSLPTGLTVADPSEDYDTHRIQLSQIGLDDLHAHGYTGQGLTIAVIDNGFLDVDQQEGFAHLFEEGRVLATRDFVEPGHDVFAPCRGSCKHGAAVLSILAARLPGELIGSAPDAAYLLFRTENDTSETHQEEDYWLAAAELADSLGAHIINSSLGYYLFDLGEGNYEPSDRDGKTALVTLAAGIAASKGILVVNSAGNEGSRGLNPPADADSILAIGAVKQDAVLSSFSSVGPTADGRIKPDVVAMGEGVSHLTNDGTVRLGNGTSYASPLTAGLAACLWQAAGVKATAQDIRMAIIRSADRFDQPDNQYGHGLPQGREAFTLLTGKEITPIPSREQFASREVLVYPNPAVGHCWIGIERMDDPASVQVELFDLMGRRIHGFSYVLKPEYNAIELTLPEQTGLYLIRVRGEQVYGGKVVVGN